MEYCRGYLVLRLVLVSPKYQLNVGYAARVAANFGVNDIAFVNPRARIRGKKAIMYAKHSHKLLSGAKVFGTLSEAVRGYDIVIGTTGIVEKTESGFSRAVLLSELGSDKRIGRALARAGSIAVVMGRDDTGLTKEEMGMCDYAAYIGTNPEYPVMNITHALAVVLYQLTMASYSARYSYLKSNKPCVDGSEKMLFELFGKIVDGKKSIRNKKAVKRVFRGVIRAYMPDEKEMHALITALK